MPKQKTLEQAYDFCLADGRFRKLDQVNVEKINALAANAAIHHRSAKIIAGAIDKNAKEWMDVYTLKYEALRTYAEALLLLEKVDTLNHQCLFSALLIHYPHLDLDWNFFEKVRTKRNGINYYGESVGYGDWKEVEVQMNLYLLTLQKETEKKL